MAPWVYLDKVEVLRRKNSGLGLGLGESNKFLSIYLQLDVQHPAYCLCVIERLMVLLRFPCDVLASGKSNIKHFDVFVEDGLKSKQASSETAPCLHYLLEMYNPKIKHGKTLFAGRDFSRLVAVPHLFHRATGST